MLTILCILAFGAAGGVQVTVTSDPPLPPPNLIRNPAIEEGQGKQPAHWRWSTAIPENFTVGWTAGGRRGKCLYIRSKSGVMSGYWSQSVRVEPGVRYRLSAYYRLASGRILAYVHGGAGDKRLDERFYASAAQMNFLVPTFLRAEYLRGPRPDRWYPLRVDFTPPPGVRAVTVSLGMYFAAGEVWYDDARLYRATAALTVMVRSDEDLARVTVHRHGEGNTMVWDSGPLKKGTRKLQHTIPDAPADATYAVTVTTASGTRVERMYPEEAAK